MKLCVLVPSEAYRSYAGARIRYHRIAAELQGHGVELALVNIDQFDPKTADCDGIIISKCHDARPLVAAAEFTRRGKLVGVDLFDDYFSQSSDSRLTRYRNWLRQLLPLCDFALCSTRAMAEVVGQHRRTLPTHIMNDPAPSDSFTAASTTAEQKVAVARDERHIRVCWFGVGDNPYFRVGLADLAAFASFLPALSRTGFDVSLKVVTNERALSADGLAILRWLPIKTEVEEWSEEAEEDALQDAFVAFLPVSAQPFSVGKSLNRAVTALSMGCQVLSVGYPLYAALDPLIYRDPSILIDDLARGVMRFSAGSASKYQRVLGTCASAKVEATKLARFLESLAPQSSIDARPLCVIHGHSTRVEAHNFVRRVDGLSVASPYCSAPFDFDVVFRAAGSGHRMLVSKSAVQRLLPHVRKRTGPSERIKDRNYVQISGSSPNGQAPQSSHWENAPIPFQLATYRESLNLVEQGLVDAFGPCRTFISETRPLPFTLAEQVS
jgi:hypothetical protein